MNFDDAMIAAGGGSVADQVAALGGTGRGGGTHRLAEAWARAEGKSYSSQIRRVQRALSSGREPAKLSAAARDAGARQTAAAMMRTATVVTVGVLSVSSSSGPSGKRPRAAGTYYLDATSRAMMAEAAALYESGMIAEAAEIVSDVILGEYAMSQGDSRDQAAGALEITDYGGDDGFTFN